MIVVLMIAVFVVVVLVVVVEMVMVEISKFSPNPFLLFPSRLPTLIYQKEHKLIVCASLNELMMMTKT